MATFATLHNETYPRICCSNPDNAQAGRTILVLGASEGIGYRIAQSFAFASAARVIIVSRNRERIYSAGARLAAILPDNLPAIIDERVCPIDSDYDVRRLWSSLKEENIPVDVMVVSAVPVMTHGSMVNLTHMANSLTGNVYSSLHMVSYFLQHCKDVPSPASQTTTTAGTMSIPPPRADMSSSEHHHPQIQPADFSWKNKVIINISSFLAHTNPTPTQGIHSTCKTATATLFQHLAEEFQASKLQIINVNPGIVLTERAARAGMNPSSLPYVNVNLPADFCVWAATSQARFLHGRFVWANWDVDELIARREMIEDNFGMLKIGLQGVDPVDMRKLFRQLHHNAPLRGEPADS